MTHTGGQALVEQLIREGVSDVFGIPGIQLDWAVDALRSRQSEIRFVVPRHEQAASYMADGYARTTGKEGVSLVVPGPGVLNALSGLATAYACNSRLLFLAGQIPSTALGRDFGLLHEIPDQSVILKSLTKWHGIAKTAGDIPGLVHEAFARMRQGRPQPVAVEIAPDLLEQKTDASAFDAAAFAPTAVPEVAIGEAARILAEANFPVIFAGGGALAARAEKELGLLAELLQAPVVVSDNGRGALSDRHPMALKPLGARIVLPKADVVLVVGSRFLNAIGGPLAANPACKYIYLNIEPIHMQAPRLEGLSLLGDAASGLAALFRALQGHPQPHSRAEIVTRVRFWCDVQMQDLQPQWGFAEVLRGALPDDGILVSELTQVGYFSNIGYPVYRPGTYISPGYQGTLGYGVPTALGVAAGNPDRAVISINGDGGFGWGLQELATAKRYNLDLTIIVFCDGHFGNVRRIQKRSFGYEFATELTNPDYAKLADAFGVAYASAHSPDSLSAALKATAATKGPKLIAVQVEEMPSPWALIHPFVPAEKAPPADPLKD